MLSINGFKDFRGEPLYRKEKCAYLLYRVKLCLKLYPPLCHIMSCHVMSYHIMSCRVMSCHVMSCHVMSCRVVSCDVASSPVVNKRS